MARLARIPVPPEADMPVERYSRESAMVQFPGGSIAEIHAVFRP
jgi:hypothetical protein